MLILNKLAALNKIIGHMIPTQQYVFRATLSRVIDGDTLDLDIDQGMHSHRLERVRLLGVNAPEMHGESAQAGLNAKAFVTVWLGSNDLTVQTYKSDVFGRYLATIWKPDGKCLNDDLLTSGNAVVFVK